MTQKELRDFIESHEMRHLVMPDDCQVRIRKAFKVEVNGMGEQWIYLSYATPKLISSSDIKNNLFKTKKEAQAMADKLRAKNKAEKVAKAKEGAKKLEEVTKYLSNLNAWEIANSSTREIKPGYKLFVNCIKSIYNRLPRNEKEDQDDYIRKLERYIKCGTFESQGLAFTKEQVTSIKYGPYGAVQIELTNGTTIIPKSKNVTKLLKLIFGIESNFYYYDVVFPEGKYDEINNKRSPYP